MNSKKQNPIKMLGLKLPTDPRWVNIVEKNIEEILTDHAYCEQKATSTAISLIVSFPEYTELVQEMVALVKEEISHFKLVHDKIIARGCTLGRDRKDSYVLEILKFFPKGGSRTTQLVHRLLYATSSIPKCCGWNTRGALCSRCPTAALLSRHAGDVRMGIWRSYQTQIRNRGRGAARSKKGAF